MDAKEYSQQLLRFRATLQVGALCCAVIISPCVLGRRLDSPLKSGCFLLIIHRSPPKQKLSRTHAHSLVQEMPKSDKLLWRLSNWNEAVLQDDKHTSDQDKWGQ